MLDTLSENMKTKNNSRLSLTSATNIILTKDPFVCSDYHLCKELVRRKKDKLNHTKDIIAMHNSFVSKDDWVLILGDLSEEEIGTIPKGYALLYSSIMKLNGKKILVLGNNDALSNESYYSMGIAYVSNKPILVNNILYSHEPEDLVSSKLDSSVINIHGHIHGSHKYRNIDPHNHIDIFWKTEENNNSIYRISEILKRHGKGVYDNPGVRVQSPFYDQSSI